MTFRVRNTGDRVLKVSPPVVQPFEDEFPVMYPVLRGVGAREIFLQRGESQDFALEFNCLLEGDEKVLMSIRPAYYISLSFPLSKRCANSGLISMIGRKLERSRTFDLIFLISFAVMAGAFACLAATVYNLCVKRRSIDESIPFFVPLFSFYSYMQEKIGGMVQAVRGASSSGGSSWFGSVPGRSWFRS